MGKQKRPRLGSKEAYLAFFFKVPPPHTFCVGSTGFEHARVTPPQSSRTALGDGVWRLLDHLWVVGTGRRGSGEGSFRRRAGSTLDGEGGEAGEKILVKPESIADVQADEGAAGEL